jgi:hypothetical protein
MVFLWALGGGGHACLARGMLPEAACCLAFSSDGAMLVRGRGGEDADGEDDGGEQEDEEEGDDDDDDGDDEGEDDIGDDTLTIIVVPQVAGLSNGDVALLKVDTAQVRYGLLQKTKVTENDDDDDDNDDDGADDVSLNRAPSPRPSAVRPASPTPPKGSRCHNPELRRPRRCPLCRRRTGEGNTGR